MDELRNRKFNTSERNHLISDGSLFAQSATFRIINGSFTNPFIKKSDLVECENNTNHNSLVQLKIFSPSPHHEIINKNTFSKGGKFVPGFQNLPLFPKSSSLNAESHRVCLKVLRHFHKSCISMPPVQISQDDLMKHKELLESMKEEQKLFYEFVSNEWKTKLCGRLLKMTEGHEKFIEEEWGRQLKIIDKYPPFYQMISMLPIVYLNEENPIEIVEIKRLQNETYSEANINIPKLDRIYHLPFTYDKIIKRNPWYKEADIQKDAVAECEKYALENNTSVVISASSLKYLANNYPPFSQAWMLPVKVKAYNMEDAKGRPFSHTIAYVDSALPPQSLSSREKAHWCYKLILRKALAKQTQKYNFADTPDAVHANSDYCQFCIAFAENYTKYPETKDLEENDSETKEPEAKEPKEKEPKEKELEEKEPEEKEPEKMEPEAKEPDITETGYCSNSESDNDNSLVIDIDNLEPLSPLQRAANITGVTTRGMARKTNESPQSGSSPNNKVSDPSQTDITSPGTSKGTTTPNKRSLNSEPTQHSTCSRQTKVKQMGKKLKNMWSDSDADKCTCGKMLNRLAMDTDENMAKFVQQILKGNKTDVEQNRLTYSLWKIGQSQQESELSKTAVKSVNFIVWSHSDGIHADDQNHPSKVLIEPKIEYQSDFGNEIITPSEAAVQWTNLQFTPDAKLLRMRINNHSSEVFMIEEFTPQTFAGELAKQTIWKPKAALGCFYNVFSCLAKLLPGDYILGHNQKHGAFAVLYHEVPKKCDNGLDLQMEFKINPTEIKLNQTAPWVPIDPNIVSPSFLENGVLPCMFAPGAVKLRNPGLKENNKQKRTAAKNAAKNAAKKRKPKKNKNKPKAAKKMDTD